MAAEIGSSYEFENFRLDPREKTLFCDDKPLALTPKVFETLQIFLEHPGHLLHKDELIQRLWQDRFVEESNLTFNIKMLRRALQDNPRAPRFIETVPRRGYRFIAEVKENPIPVSARIKPKLAARGVASQEISSTRSSARIKPIYLWIAIVSVFLIGAAGIGLRSSSRSLFSTTAPILSAPFRSEKISNSGRTHAVITPDGKYVAYSNESDGKQSIWLRQLETGENIQIVPPSEALYLGLAISHDGNSLYYARRDNPADGTSSAIYRVMTFGGVPSRITTKNEGWISISPDDKQLSFVRCPYNEADFCSLFVVGTDGANERVVLTRKRPFSISDNQFSPDGKSIAFASGQSWNGGSDYRLMRIDLASRAESEISPKRFFDIRNLKWLPDGSGLLLTALENFDRRVKIWQVSVADGTAQALTKDATDYISLSLDKAADRMIATSVSNSFRLFLAALDDLNHPRNLVAARTGVAFAPEGRIVYSGDDGNIWTMNHDGSEHRQLTNGPSAEIVPKVSPDGRYIFFSSNRSGTTQLWRMNSDGSNQIQITKSEGGYPKFVTPDGKTVYFESCLHRDLWRVSADGSGTESQFLDGPIRIPAFSPDGSMVAYYFYPDEKRKLTKIALLSVESRRIIKTFSLPDEFSHSVRIAWAADNRNFYYIAPHGPTNYLWRQSIDTDQPVLAGDLGPEEFEDFTVSPDGKEIGFIRGRWIHDAVLIDGLK